jgi:hypothetical protein
MSDIDYEDVVERLRTHRVSPDDPETPTADAMDQNTDVGGPDGPDEFALAADASEADVLEQCQTVEPGEDDYTVEDA